MADRLAVLIEIRPPGLAPIRLASYHADVRFEGHVYAPLPFTIVNGAEGSAARLEVDDVAADFLRRFDVDELDAVLTVVNTETERTEILPIPCVLYRRGRALLLRLKLDEPATL